MTGTLHVLSAAVAVAALLCAACGASCKGKAARPPRQKISVTYRLEPSALAVSAPGRDSRCAAYRVEVKNEGYARVELRRESFSLDLEGKTLPPAPEERCRTHKTFKSAALINGGTWTGDIPFELPHFIYEARLLLKPASASDGFWGEAVPRVEYSILPGPGGR